MAAGEAQNVASMSEPVRQQADLKCGECGKFGAFDFGERKLCSDCYEHCGSCCPEFGKEETHKD
jgi:hypothetical protein